MSSFSNKIKEGINFLNDTGGNLKKKTIRSVFWVGISSVGLNIFSFFRTVILARLLTPEIFGLMGICLIVKRGIDIFTETGFGAALIHRQEKFEGARDTAFILMVIRGFVLSITVFLIAPLIANYYERPILDSLIKVLGISFVFSGFYNINTVAVQKELDFKQLTYLAQTTSFLNLLMVITLAYYLRSVWALVIAQVLTSLIGSVLSYLIIPGRPRLRFDIKFAKELFGYGKFITGMTIVTFIAAEIDNIVIGKIIGMEALGYYVLAYTLANLPVTHITKVINRTMFPVCSKLQNDLPALRAVYLNVLKFVSSLTIPAAVGIAVLAPEIVNVLYGEQWLPAVKVLQIMCVFSCVLALTSCGYIFNAIGKPNIPFYINSFRLALIVLIIYPLTLKFGLIGAAMAVTIPIMIKFLITILTLKRVIGIELLPVLKDLAKTLGYSFVMTLAVICYKHYMTTNIFPLIQMMAIGMFTYTLMRYREISSTYKKIKG